MAIIRHGVNRNSAGTKTVIVAKHAPGFHRNNRLRHFPAALVAQKKGCFKRRFTLTI